MWDRASQALYRRMNSRPWKARGAQPEFGVTPPGRRDARAAQPQQARQGGPAAPAAAQPAATRRCTRPRARRRSRPPPEGGAAPAAATRATTSSWPRGCWERFRPPRAVTACTRSAGNRRTQRSGDDASGDRDRRRTVRPHRTHAGQECSGHHRSRHQEHLLPEAAACSTSWARSRARTRRTKSSCSAPISTPGTRPPARPTTATARPP